MSDVPEWVAGLTPEELEAVHAEEEHDEWAERGEDIEVDDFNDDYYDRHAS
ncbi:hypothetical protein [Streptosporangium jomthongense]|uniref:Uncharacterized protein n=1 Tax=Streptosporangium jomthongense TaxID=1193683 RepID=A0ABV8EXX9_9ACTN